MPTSCEGAELPVRAAKPVRPSRTGTAYVLMDHADDVFLIRRPPSGLLGGMLALPETPPAGGANWRDAGQVKHIFTHFALTLTVLVARTKNLPASELRAPAATAPRAWPVSFSRMTRGRWP